MVRAAAGAAAVGGLAYGAVKHREAQMHAAMAQQANARAASATREAESAESRARKLATELAHALHTQIAQLRLEDVPPLEFEGCSFAATDGVRIYINMTWLLSGIVDPARERGAIWGRVAGSLAHEWFHFLDTAHGTRDSHDEELKADAFAGRQLARLSISPDHFAHLLSTFPESATHPPGPLRSRTLLDAHGAEKRKMNA